MRSMNQSDLSRYAGKLFSAGFRLERIDYDKDSEINDFSITVCGSDPRVEGLFNVWDRLNREDRLEVD